MSSSPHPLSPSRSPSPEFSPLTISADLTPLPTYKAAATTSISFSGLLEPPLLLHEDLAAGCGGQLWPAGMVLARYLLRYQSECLGGATILELGAGGGLVGLAVALGCEGKRPIYVTDQENMLGLMQRNVELNRLESRVVPLVLDWGSPLPAAILARPPTIILAADCVYFEPAFPLLLETLSDLLTLSPNAKVYFCFKKRRRADMNFMKSARKKFVVKEVEDDARSTWGREGVGLWTFTKRC